MIQQISFLALQIILHIAISKLCPDPVEDEKHHIPQGKRFLLGNYMSWDPMITTPPGLYILSTVMTIGRSDLCTSLLRETSVIMSILISWLGINNSYLICLLPITFPYTHLYYTDVPGLAFVLLADHILNSGHFLLSAIVSYMSIWSRQTNIVWTGRLLGELCFLWTEGRLSFLRLSIYSTPFIVIIIGFAVFVKVNDGVALGDRSNHKMSLHLPNFFYCATIIFLFTMPIQLSELRDTLLLCTKSISWYLLSVSLHVFAVQNFT